MNQLKRKKKITTEDKGLELSNVYLLIFKGIRKALPEAWGSLRRELGIDVSALITTQGHRLGGWPTEDQVLRVNCVLQQWPL